MITSYGPKVLRRGLGTSRQGSTNIVSRVTRTTSTVFVSISLFLCVDTGSSAKLSEVMRNRYCTLYAYGGIYTDMDLEPYANFYHDVLQA